MSLRVEIFPSQLDSVVGFYRNVLLFEVVSDSRGSAWPYVSLQRGLAVIGVSWRDAEVDQECRRPPSGTEIVFEVSDVVAERDRIKAVWDLDEDLTDRPWGLTDFRITDPAGYYLRVTNRHGVPIERRRA